MSLLPCCCPAPQGVKAFAAQSLGANDAEAQGMEAKI